MTLEQKVAPIKCKGVPEKDWTGKFTETSEVLTNQTRKLGGGWCSGTNYFCDNCGAKNTIVQDYVIERVTRVPKPEILGDKARPVIYERERTVHYRCSNCGIENAELPNVARVSVPD